MKKLLVVFVCSGNTCRSPMAEFLFRRFLDSEDIDNVEVTSCGIKAAEGAPMSPEAVKTLANRGIKGTENFVAKQLTKDIFKKADLIVALSDRIQIDIEEQFGENKKILGFGSNLPNTSAVSDPYGQGMFEYEQACSQIEINMSQVAKYIFRNILK